MLNIKNIQNILFAVGVLFLTACGKDWQKDVDRAVEAYKDGRYDEAVPVFVEAAEHGHDGGQYMLGVCYEWGLGVETNYEEALKWYRKAAEQGLAEAEMGVGFCYYAGHGVKQDYTEAAKWIRKSAEQGYPHAEYVLGTMYELGLGVKKDEKEAVKWLRKSAEADYVPSQKELGSCYETGSGVEKDDAEAVKWYRKAANQGDLSVHYYDPESGRLRQYYPDFLAKMADGSYQLIEVKGDNMIDDAVVNAKKAAAEEMALASGVEYLMYAGSEVCNSHILEDKPSKQTAFNI